MVKVIQQKITKNYAIYNGDCVKVMKNVRDNSIGLSIFSPPFSDLYCYSDSPEDMGNSHSPEEFFQHFDYLVEELQRVMRPGRIVAVHCADLPIRKQEKGYIGQYDFPGDLVRCFIKHNFIYHGRVCIWKDPLVLFMRTKLTGLAHKQIVSDSSLCRNGNADYVLTFRKKGDNSKPIRHPNGLRDYHGQRKVPHELDRFLSKEVDPKVNKRSHWIWQQYASPVWFDIRQMKVLPFRGGKDKDDEKHCCPLQLDVVERCLVLWSNPKDIILTPFMGIGTEVYIAVKNGRKGIGIELKKSFFKQAMRNLGSFGSIGVEDRLL